MKFVKGHQEDEYHLKAREASDEFLKEWIHRLEKNLSVRNPKNSKSATFEKNSPPVFNKFLHKKQCHQALGSESS